MLLHNSYINKKQSPNINNKQSPNINELTKLPYAHTHVLS